MSGNFEMRNEENLSEVLSRLESAVALAKKWQNQVISLESELAKSRSLVEDKIAQFQAADGKSIGLLSQLSQRDDSVADLRKQLTQEKHKNNQLTRENEILRTINSQLQEGRVSIVGSERYLSGIVSNPAELGNPIYSNILGNSFANLPATSALAASSYSAPFSQKLISTLPFSPTPINKWLNEESFAPKLPYSLVALKTLNSADFAGLIHDEGHIKVGWRAGFISDNQCHFTISVTPKNPASQLTHIKALPEGGTKGFTLLFEEPEFIRKEVLIRGKLTVNHPYEQPPVVCISGALIESIGIEGSLLSVYVSLPLPYVKFFARPKKIDLLTAMKVWEGDGAVAELIVDRVRDGFDGVYLEISHCFGKLTGVDASEKAWVLVGQVNKRLTGSNEQGDETAVVRVEVGTDARIFGRARIHVRVSGSSNLLARSVARSFAAIVAAPGNL